MEDPDTGAGAPEVGASRASPPPSGQASPPAGRQNRRPVQPWSGHGQAGDASQHQTWPEGQDQEAAQTQARAQGFRARRRSPRCGRSGGGCRQRSRPAAPAEAIVAALPSVAPSRPEPAARRPPLQELPVFAALDLGTNNCRLLVAVPTRPRPVPRHRRLFAHRAAGRGAHRQRPARAAGDGPRRRGAEDLRRQACAAARSGRPG